MDDFFETAPLGIHVGSADGRILRANAEEFAMLGYPREEYVGRPLTDFHVDRAAIEGLLACLRRGEVVHSLESQARCKDGTLRWLRMSANPLMEAGKFVRWHCFSRDVTAAKEAESALRSSEERYHRLVEGVREYAIHGLHPEGRVADWNRGAEQLYGWSEVEALGRDFSSFFAPEDVAAGMSERMLRLACTEGHFHHAGWRTRKDGTRFWAEVTLTALRGVEGHVQEIAHATRDASERRRLDALRRKAADLSAANLVVMNAQRKTAHLLGTVASLLQAPMVAIERAAARLRAPEAPADAVLDAADAVQDGMAELRRELARSQDLASTGGGDEAQTGTVDLLRLAVEARDVLREAAHAREIRVEIDVDPELSSAVTDTGGIDLILHNLLASAIKLSRDGSCVTLRLLPEGPGAFRIEAEGTGPGLSADEVERLLQGGHRPGTGLHSAAAWISPTKQIVEQRGGRLVIKSVLGRGSVFSVVLPRKPLALSALRDDAGGRAYARGSTAGHVLVVADGASARASLGWTFGGVGWEVISVVSVEEAFDVLLSHTFDLIAVDMALGQIGAVDFVSRLRHQGIDRSVPHVLAVFHVGAASVAGLLVADVVPQPAPADQLFAALERANVARGRDAPILVLDADREAGSATARTLDLLGYRPIVTTDAEGALRTCAERPPSAVVLCPLPLGPDAFEFVHHLRWMPELRHVPLFLQAPRSVQPAVLEAQRKAAEEALQRGVGHIHQVLEDAGLPRTAAMLQG